MSKEAALFLLVVVGVIVLWGALTGWTFSGRLPREGAKCTPDEGSKDENSEDYIYNADKECLIVNTCKEGWKPNSSNTACISTLSGDTCTGAIENGIYKYDTSGECVFDSCVTGFEKSGTECISTLSGEEDREGYDRAGGDIQSSVANKSSIREWVAAALCYGNMHPDLKDKICNGGCFPEHTARLVKHFVDHGMKENRVYCTPQINRETRAEMGTRGDTFNVSVKKEEYRVEPDWAAVANKSSIRNDGGISRQEAAALCYGNMHPDLKDKVCNGGCLGLEHAERLVKHFVDQGMKENRVYCTPQINSEIRAEAQRYLRPDNVSAKKEGYRVEPFQRRYKQGAIRGIQI